MATAADLAPPQPLWTFHLSGQHDQHTHGRGGGSPADLHSEAAIHATYNFHDQATGLTATVTAIRGGDPQRSTYVEIEVTDRSGKRVGGGERTMAVLAELDAQAPTELTAAAKRTRRTVSGPTLDELDEAADAMATLVARHLGRVAGRAARNLGGITTADARLWGFGLTAADRPREHPAPVPTARQAAVSADDIGMITDQWAVTVSTVLAPAIAADYTAAWQAQQARIIAAAGLSPEQVALFSQPTIDIQEAAQVAASQAWNRLKGIGDDLWGNARASLVEGMAAGEPVTKLAARVQAAAGVTAPRASVIARTESMTARNTGAYDEMATAAALGIVDSKTWLCVTGDTRIWSFEPLEIVKRRRAPACLVRIRTMSDVFTVTPEHPVLTRRGWVPAYDLRKTDQLVKYRPVQSPDRRVADFVDVGPVGPDVNVQDGPPRIDEVFRAATKRSPSRRMMLRVVNLDGEITNSEVQVVALHGDLAAWLQTPFREPIRENVLIPSDVGLETLFTDSPALKLWNRGPELVTSPLGLDTAGGDQLSVGLSGAADNGVSRLAVGADRHASLLEVAGNYAGTDLVIAGDGGASFARYIALDDVLDVVEFDTGWHDVYDLTTERGWFVVGDGVIVHNSTHDARTRPTHVAADGQTVPFDGKFIVGGWPADHPHDPMLPAEEAANCRCTVIWNLSGEKPVYPLAAATPIAAVSPLWTFEAPGQARDRRGRWTDTGGAGIGSVDDLPRLSERPTPSQAAKKANPKFGSTTKGPTEEGGSPTYREAEPPQVLTSAAAGLRDFGAPSTGGR